MNLNKCISDISKLNPHTGILCIYSTVEISIMDIYLKYILEAYMNKVDILIKHTHISVY